MSTSTNAHMEGLHDRLSAWPVVSVHKLSVMRKLWLLHFINKWREVGWRCSFVCRSQIAKFMRPTWGPPGSCWPQMGPMLALWNLLSGVRCYNVNCGWYINISSYYIMKWCADASHGRFTPTYYTKRLRYASHGRAFIQPIIFFLYMRIRKVTLVNASMSIRYVIVVEAKVITMWHGVLPVHELTIK